MRHESMCVISDKIQDVIMTVHYARVKQKVCRSLKLSETDIRKAGYIPVHIL